MSKTLVYVFDFINFIIFLVLAIALAQFEFNTMITLIIFGTGSFIYLLRGVYHYKKHKR